MENSTQLSKSLPIAVQRAASSLSLAGNIGFWVQLVLGVIATLILLFASTTFIGGDRNDATAQGSAFAIFCAAGGVLALIVSIIFFFRYRRMGQAMQDPDPINRPKKTFTLRMVKLGLVANLVGMLLAIIGAEAFAGVLFAKAAKIPQGAAVFNTTALVEPVEIMVILANTHTISSHFAGIVVGLWLLDRLNR
ncbi:MAG: DUF3611 family protein [Chloroflexaceae bacterium]|nr:DUF3611 family protein [Chloroflexaceae bacterium]